MPNLNTCSFPECENPMRANTLCDAHAKQRRRGKQLKPLQRRSRVGASPSERLAFFAMKNPTTGCHEWTGSLSNKGYGETYADGKYWLAHRLSYTLANGPIPEGMHVDHVCWNTACVNPAHLRAVTPKQNQENRSGANSGTASGVRGVCWVGGPKPWRAVVTHNRKTISAGEFATVEEAEAAVIAKRLDVFTHNGMDRAA